VGEGREAGPRGSATGSAGNPGQGTCDRGARAGQPCETTNSSGLSADCIPGGSDGSSDLGSISVDLTPLVTGTASDSDPQGLFCPGQTTGGGNEGCFGSTACRSFSRTRRPARPLCDRVPSTIALASAWFIRASGYRLVAG